MKKRIIALLCLTVLGVTMLCSSAYAATPVDPASEASLTLLYQKDGHAFPDLSICIYRVAKAFADGTFELIEPYSSYPVNIHDITLQEQWKHTASTLTSYIVADQVAPYRQGTTDANGTVVFEQLETGLYLVSEAVAENNSGTYVFNRFMVYLPTPAEDGSFDYDVEANPKCINFVAKNEYRVTKLWQDAGNQADRPQEVTVDIYRDGKLYDTQILSADNNWSYIWYVSEDDRSQWTVAERTVPQFYTVSVLQNGHAFSIINTRETPPDDPVKPPTGDMFNMFPYILAMCISGSLLIILGIHGKRRREI